MKMMIFTLGLLSSVSAFATTETYSVGAAYVIPTSPGQDTGADAAKCPNITTAKIEVKDGSLAALGLTLTLEDKTVIALEPSGTSHTCYSDIVCPTNDDFLSQNKDVLASATRNNDGAYPTTDKAGHNGLAALVTVGAQNLACYYSIQ